MKRLGNLSVKINNKAAICKYIRHLNLDTNIALHTVAEPAVQAAVKLTVLGNDAIIAFFFEANKNKENAIIALASSNN